VSNVSSKSRKSSGTIVVACGGLDALFFKALSRVWKTTSTELLGGDFVSDTKKQRPISYVVVSEGSIFDREVASQDPKVLKVVGEAVHSYYKAFSGEQNLILPTLDEKKQLLEIADFPFFVSVAPGMKCRQCMRELNGYDIMKSAYTEHGDDYLRYLHDAVNGMLLVHVLSPRVPVPCSSCGAPYNFFDDQRCTICNPYKYWDPLKAQ
jgi:hypothetical protein